MLTVDKMKTFSKMKSAKWIIVVLLLLLIGAGLAGCGQPGSPSSPQTPQPNPQQNPQPNNNAGGTDSQAVLLSQMMQKAGQGKVINHDFAAKATTIDMVEKAWGQADQTEYIAAAKGRYATYASHNAVFGINKGEQIFEVRSSDPRLKGIRMSKVREVYGTPPYDLKTETQEIIGYPAGTEFKIELIFPLATSADPDPVMDHYNVLYPPGTVNNMAGDPGREW